MVVLRADPWMPDYGMGFEASADEPPAGVDHSVESTNWSLARIPERSYRGAVWFVDGVRRVELRLLADSNERRAPGLFGSYAVGGVLCEASSYGAARPGREPGRAAAFGAHEVSRAVILGGGLRAERIDVPAGAGRLVFEPSSVAGDEPDAPLLGLQDLMRKAEGRLAARLGEGDAGALVLTDGPLAFFDPTPSPVVGVIKRTSRRYLPPEQEALLARIEPGQRTPLFALGDEERIRRYSWYTRLVPLRSPWHDHAGILRCEVRAGVGVGGATELADGVSGLLAFFAGRPIDPRAPQNLAPVGALETWLRHRMGHAVVVRRALVDWLIGRQEVAF